MDTKNIIKFTQEGIGELTGFIDEQGKPWFFAGKVCDCLKIKNSSDSLRLLKEKHLRFGHKIEGVDILYPLIQTSNGRQRVAIINENLLYELIFQSRTEKAFLFRQWVFTEVLPSIRKTGAFRTERKLIRRSLTDTIKAEICDKTDNEGVKKFSYSTFTIMINKSLGLPAKIGDRDSLPIEVQAKLAKREDTVRSLIDEGKSYQEIKNIIESL